MKKLFSTILVLGLLLSENAYAGLLNFGFSDKLKKISPGDNPSKVEKKLGKPDGFKVRGEFTIYNYNHKLISEWAWDRDDYHKTKRYWWSANLFHLCILDNDTTRNLHSL